MVKDVKYSREFCEQSIISEGGIRGMATLQNGTDIHINVVVNFLSQVIFVFLLFLGMLIYANEVKTTGKIKIT